MFANTLNEEISSSEKYTFKFYPKDNFFKIKFQGEIGLKNFIDCYSDFVRHPLFVINMGACFDFTDAFVELDINESNIFYKFSSGMREKRGDEYQLAFVCGDTMTKATAELYRLSFSRTNIDVEIFDNVVIATQWFIESNKMAV